MVHAVLMPAAARSSLDREGLENETILFSIPTDISLDGQPQTEWLIATPSRLSVVRSNGSDDVLRSVIWDEVDEVRTVAGVGSGRLQIRCGELWTDLVRYSNSLAQRFHKLSRYLDLEAGNDALDADIADRIDAAKLDPPRCSECQLRLPPGTDPQQPNCPRCMQQGRIIRRVIELVAPYKYGAVTLCVLTVIGIAAELVPPKLQQYMVDHILAGGGEPIPATAATTDFRTALLVVVLALAASRIMVSAVAFINGRVATMIGVGLTGRLRDEMVAKLGTLSIAYFDRHNNGSIISRVSHDSEALHGLMHQFTGGFLMQAIKLIGVGIMLMMINPKLAFFTLIPVPLVFLGSWIFWNRVYPRYYRLRDASAKQMSALNGMLHGIRVVKAFGREDDEFTQFQTARQHLTKLRLWVDVTNSGYAASMQIVFSLGGLIVWYVGGRDVIGKEMTLGELIAFLAYLAMFYAPLSALSNFTTWMTSFLSGSKRVLELLDTPASISESSNPVPWNQPHGAIRFQNVTFGYDPNQPVLKGVSFDVAPGEMIGIVGRSGSGKTTIVNLLSRFYDTQEGSIMIDGTDVRDLRAHDLRKHIGIVLQDSCLFRGTIAKNLCYGHPAATIEQALAAAKAAGAHDFICRQPLGYDTWLGQHGAGLSGGEKQRLSIARTLLYDPKVLILDEATSNIDAESEKMIQDALEKLTAGRTTVAIAHRLSTLRNADRILVFDNGDLIEQGSHAELIRKDGKYARMVRIQMQVSKDPNVDQLLEDADPSAVMSKNESISPNQAQDHQVDGDQDRDDHAIESSPVDIQWLDPKEVRFHVDQMHRLSVMIGDREVAEGLFCIRAFPAQFSDRYISVRRWDEHGDVVEIGMISDLSEWDEANRRVVREALDRHYLVRHIRRVHKISLAHGYLDLTIDTDEGLETITMRWTGSQAIDFADRGKLIIDTEDNRYLVDDVNQLPKPDRQRFLQYIYW